MQALLALGRAEEVQRLLERLAQEGIKCVPLEEIDMNIHTLRRPPTTTTTTTTATSQHPQPRPPPPPPRPDGRILAIRARLRFQRQDWKGALRLLKVLLDR